MMIYHMHQLPNGIRILYYPTDSTISHCCLMVNAGSRDEEKGKDGLAHFIEHLLFKATERRTTNQILNRLEVVGADLNAYTTKEYTCIHASFLAPHLERAMDLMEDIFFHSTFPEEDMEKEKGVVLDEIASYQDQPEEAIQDDFEDMLFKNHALGRNILGNLASVSGLTRADITSFINQNYNTHQAVFAVTGNYDFNKVIKLAERYFGQVPENNQPKNRIQPKNAVGEFIRTPKQITQTHCVLGSNAYASFSTKKTALLLLNNVLGGNGMSSRLNLEIREKHGIAYTIESSYSPLTDSGIFSVYFGTDAEKAEKAMKLVQKELQKLRDKKLGGLQLHQAKQKFIGQIALAEENRLGLILSMAKSLMDFGRIDTLEEVFAKINAVSADELLAISNEIFEPNRMLTLIFEPES